MHEKSNKQHIVKNTHTNYTHIIKKKRKKITRLCNNHGGNIEIRVPFYLDIINAFFPFYLFTANGYAKRERKK